MKKYKKLILILILICFISIVVGIAGLSLIKNEKDNNHDAELEDNNKDYVKKVTDIKTVYNVGICINTMLEDYYDKLEFRANDSLLLPHNLVNMLNFQDGKKSFYIESAFLAEMDENIDVYFTKGYVVRENGTKRITDDSLRKPLAIMLILDSEYNTGKLNLIGEGYTDIFKYNEDISKTEILKTSGLKIKKIDSDKKRVEERLMENEFFQNKTVDQNIQESELVRWYLMDYLIKTAENNYELVPETVSFSYSGNFDDGFKIIGYKNKEYFIKPSLIPMEYDVQIE